MTADRLALQVHGRRDVDPDVGFEGARHQHGGHLVGRAGLRVVARERSRRGGRIERSHADDPVVAVVEVLLAEEDRGGVGTEDDLGPVTADGGHQRLAELGIVGQLAVGIVEPLLAGHADQGAGLGRLGRPLDGQGPVVDGGVGRALASVGAQQDVHLAAALGPRGQGPPARHVGVVGMGVDGQGLRRDTIQQLGHGLALRSLRGRRLGEEADLPAEVVHPLESLVDAGEAQVRHLVDQAEALEHRDPHLL